MQEITTIFGVLNINRDYTSACVYVPIHPGASKEHGYYTTQIDGLLREIDLTSRALK